MKDLVIIGAGGLGKEVAWLIERINKLNNEPKWNLLGFIDDNPILFNKIINSYDVIGNIDYLIENLPKVNVICAIASPIIRKKIISKLGKMNYISLIDPSVKKSELVDIGKGCIVCADVIFTVNIQVKDFSIIDRKCNIGHDSVIEEFSTLYPGVILSGNTIIKKCVEIGSNSCVIQNLTVGEHSIVGAGATVINDLPCNCTAVGTPAKPIKYHDEK